jgi:hypothetical protein
MTKANNNALLIEKKKNFKEDQSIFATTPSNNMVSSPTFPME